ncbi:UDP-N-acetylmuramoyl-L-alanine--D-glutamate ligase [Advenella sp. S44]|uniref:UDP-N-acetylmuramoyl-L-alanine--D-glutamate ligase n=1 Tax=Advenella sp. S44 TaxID=1982755 RepID=UPI000C2B3EFA|nr:UDP-N-acetylmuramoyl-L-alanine--D-glutamate ligase [Advenella sp. S44]PJX22447.1 UDP-N-acetylmuramoyl-L-alanine--D-glutamate ligase [Advenella sp. S44]
MTTDTDGTAVFPSCVLILGLGETGLASALWCLRQNAALHIVDTRDNPPGLVALQEHGEADITQFLGEQAFTDAALEGVQQIVLSPGLAPSEPALAAFLHKAQQRQIPIIGEIELFALALADLAAAQDYRPRVLAITGTNGKTTVTSLTQAMLQTAGKTAIAAGNISPSALTALMQAMDTESLPEAWVLELSSFQMQTTRSLVPDAAAVLNLTQDHLDWHRDMQEYAAAKASLLAASRIAIVNRNDAAVVAMVADIHDVQVRSFGVDGPPLVGDTGMESAHGVLWITASEKDDFELPEAPSARRRKNVEKPKRKAGLLKRLMPADAMQIRGQHNMLNVQAAMLLCRELGIGWGPMLNTLREFSAGLYRTQFERSIRGVDFFNDSKGTNVGATAAALDGMGRDIVLIAGGVGKGQDFSPLAAPVRRCARAVILMGQAAEQIEQALAQTGVACHRVPSMQAAVSQALALAQPGDAVLMSPACSSFDMFESYAHRGQVFSEAVQELALDNGEVA